MNFAFNTKEELFTRVKPALNVKLQELKRSNYSEINEEDIWDYLSYSKWSKSHDLMLSDIVSDIIHANNKDIYEFSVNKKRGTL